MSIKEKIKGLSKYSIITCFLALELFAFLAFSFSGSYLVYGIFATVLFVILVLFSFYEIKTDGISKIAFLLFPLLLFSLLTAVGYYSLNHVILGDFSMAEVVFVPIGIVSIGLCGYLLSLNQTFKMKTFLIVIYSALALLVLLNFLTTTINFGPFHTIFYRDAYMYYGGVRSSVKVGQMAYTLEGFRFIETTIGHYTLYPALLLSCSTLLFHISFKEEKKLFILYICLTSLAALVLVLAPSIEGLFAVFILVLINAYLFVAKRFPKAKKGINIALIVGVSLMFLGVFFMILASTTEPNFVKNIITGNKFLNKLILANRICSKFTLVIRDVFTSRYFLGFSHYFYTEYIADEIYLTGSYIFNTFMTSGVIGAIALFFVIIKGIVNFNGYFKNDEEKGQHREGTLSFVLMFYMYSILFNDGEYTIFYNLHRPIYVTGPFLLTIFIFFFVGSKRIIEEKRKPEITQEETQNENE